MSRRWRTGIVGIVLVVAVVVSWFFLLSPLREEISETEQAIEAEQDRLAAAQAKVAQAETTRSEGTKNRARLLELAKMVPESAEIPSLILQVQDLADKSGIDFIAVSPSEPTLSEGFQIVPLQLQFQGTFFDVSDFVYRVEQMVAGPGRLVAVKNLQLRLSGSAESSQETVGLGAVSPELEVSMTLYAFTTAGAVAPAVRPTTTSTTAP